MSAPVSNLVVAVRRRPDPHQLVAIAEFGRDAGPHTLRYPDIVVDRAGSDTKDYTATAPALVAEVLSPSAAKIDLGDEAADYLQNPNLLAHVVLSQDEPKGSSFMHKRANNSRGGLK